MRPKPAGLDARYAAQFDDPSVVEAYGARPPYPEDLLALVVELAGRAGREGDRRVLDLGCGTGEIARRLAPHVAAITAIDRSERMIARARSLAGGSAPNIVWLVGSVEDVDIPALAGPFSLALAAESFHWFDWDIITARLCRLAPAPRLLLVEGRDERRSPWSGELRSLIARFSTNRDFQPYALVDELMTRCLFSVEGRRIFGPVAFTQSIDDYIISIHSRNGFSRDRMSAQAASDFDQAVREAVRPYAKDDDLELLIETRVTWGQLVVQSSESPRNSTRSADG